MEKMDALRSSFVYSYYVIIENCNFHALQLDGDINVANGTKRERERERESPYKRNARRVPVNGTTEKRRRG